MPAPEVTGTIMVHVPSMLLAWAGIIPPDKDTVCVPLVAVNVPEPLLVVAGVVDGSVQLYVYEEALLMESPFGKDPERVLVKATASMGYVGSEFERVI